MAKCAQDVECNTTVQFVLDYQIETADEDPFGRLKSGYLRIQGRVLDASLWKGLPFHFKNPKSFRIIGTCETLRP
jgi:hypothetical protein